MDTQLIKRLILSGDIKTFGDLFTYATEKEIAEAMGCGVKQVRAIRKDCSVMTLGQLFGLCAVLDIIEKKERNKVMELFCE